MGEEVTQLVIADAGCGVEEHEREEQLLTSIDETDHRAIPASPLNGEELIEKCEEIKTNCDGKPHKAEEVSIEKRVIAVVDASALATATTTTTTVAAIKPQDISIEKSKKWYSFIHRSGGGGNSSVTSTIPSNLCNSRSSNSCEKKISDKMDKRHSWHLNDSAVVEM